MIKLRKASASNTNTLEVVKNKKERQSFDALSFCTRSGNRTHTPFGTRV